MKEIKLTQGQVTTVDDTDYDWLNQWKWYAMKVCNTFYAVRNIRKSDGKQRKVLMHRVILGLKSSDPHEADHRNGNGLCNKQNNLRIVTHAQNLHNQRPQKNCSSVYKGVCWKKQYAKWRAQIKKNKQETFLGYFDNEIDAAKTYDKAAKLFFGKFAQTNF